MLYYIKETVDVNGKDAGSKAVLDINSILERNGARAINILCGKISRGLRLHIANAVKIKKRIESADIQKDDILIIQTPLRSHTIFFAKILKGYQKAGIKNVLLVHDLNFIRSENKVKSNMGWGKRIYIEEMSVLRCADAIIVHNEQMKEMLSVYGIPKNRMTSLKIFDYLMDNDEMGYVQEEQKHDYSVVIAGNLDPKKSSYVYNLPKEIKFVLYGTNYVTQYKSNVHYMGSFLPEELPYVIQEDFGLVWDGDSIESCSGAYGEYLRYNNPHKTSLYLACGIPVITWKEAAIASFIRENNVGIVVENLNELKDALQEISHDAYAVMRRNAKHLAIKLRRGGFFEQALKICLER